MRRSKTSLHKLTFGASGLTIRSMWGNPRQSWILDSTLWIPDSKYWSPDPLRWKMESGFHELDYGFQSQGSRIPQANISWIPGSGLPFGHTIHSPFFPSPCFSTAYQMANPRKTIRRVSDSFLIVISSVRCVLPVIVLIPSAMSRATVAVNKSFSVIAGHFSASTSPQLCFHIHPLLPKQPAVLSGHGSPFSCFEGVSSPPWGAVIMRLIFPGSYSV